MSKESNRDDDPPMDVDDDDNNAILDVGDEDNEDPFVLAVDDLEGRVITAVNTLKTHPGVRSPNARSIHDELSIILRPVLEVTAHTAPSVARTYNRGPEGVEDGVEQAYERVISDLLLPVILEIAQSDPIASKRGASLEFFRSFWKECHKAGSWIDTSTIGPNAGPYGAGGGSSAFANTPSIRAMLKRRQQKTMTREGEILRYWVESANACLVEGVFTAEDSEVAAVSRGILAASAVLRPALRHISQRIRDADDRGAVKLFNPVMRMVEGVLKKLFIGTNETVRSSCLKFMEIVVICFSYRPEDPGAARRRSQTTAEGFSLSDLPTGHPTITREALESIAEYSFTVFRGMTLLGGQVKIDANILSDMVITNGSSSAADSVVSVLKPAALAFLDLEASANPKDDDLDVVFGDSETEFDFTVSQKGYVLCINAIAAIALQRPVFFKEGALCLARKSSKPLREDDSFDHTARLVIASQLRSSCLTLLRNVLSVTSGVANVLHGALSRNGMSMQADKALEMASHAMKLKSATRSARNQAKMFYEWDTSESAGRSSKRQKETDDALAKMRAAKKARGLGNGIQLPSNMAEATDLVLLNLQHFSSVPKPKAKPKEAKSRKLNFLVDAIMTNGKSLVDKRGGWYDRDGGDSWNYNPREGLGAAPKLISDINDFATSPEPRTDLSYSRQCKLAAANAFDRVLSAASNTRSGDQLASLAHQLVARLALTMEKTESLHRLGYSGAKNSLIECKKLGLDTAAIEKFIEEYPLVAEATATAIAQQIPDGAEATIYESLLMQALAHGVTASNGDAWKDSDSYDLGLELYVAMMVHAGTKMVEKPGDAVRRNRALTSSVNFRRGFGALPRLPHRVLTLICEMCNVDELSRRFNETNKKPQDNEERATAAAIHASKEVAEKRADTALVLLLDASFHRCSFDTRKHAISCAVSLASGQKPSSHQVHAKALKMLLNVIFPRSALFEDLVVKAALSELDWATAFAIQNFDDIQSANSKSETEGKDRKWKSTAPRSELEKKTMDRLRRLTDLIMAICVRRPEVIRPLFKCGCRSKADVLSRTLQANMHKLATAAATRYGTAAIAEMVAGMTEIPETPMLLDFLEKLVPTAKLDHADEIIQVCLDIQERKVDTMGKKDYRFMIPVVSIMKREDIAKQLVLFCSSEDHVFVAALFRMGEKLGRQMLLVRDEPEGDRNPLLRGMTPCEQLVYLHKLDFASHGLPQKRYLACIKMCLDHEELFTDQVWFAAFDYMSGTFLSERETLPLGFMRSVILVCTKHESLHSWICNVLLKRLVEAEIWIRDERQWEGWMRCAKMLEGRAAGPSSEEAVRMLPDLQQMQYKSKWKQK